VNPLEFGVMFGLGLVGSLHCVQMCGPIVLSYSVAIESSKGSSGTRHFSSLLKNHLVYNAGRILTYCALGAGAGLAGESLGRLGTLEGYSHVLAMVSGVLMLLVGFSMLGVIPVAAGRSNLFRIPSALLRRIARLIAAPASSNRFFLGLALGFLPCGLVYAALFKAMSAGTAIAGAVTMLAFGLGTASALLALGIFSSALRIRLNRWGSQLAAVGVTLMGAVLMWRGMMPGMLVMEGHIHAHH